ncbi:MAG: hypothetical protein ACFFGZ_20210 [Candidatus Thorarchaeota archaeon]
MSPLCNQCAEYFIGQQCPKCGAYAARSLFEGLPSYMEHRKSTDEELSVSEERKRLLEVMAQIRGEFSAKNLYETIKVSVPTTKALIREMKKKGHLKCVRSRVGDSPALYALTEAGYNALRYWTGSWAVPNQKERLFSALKETTEPFSVEELAERSKCTETFVLMVLRDLETHGEAKRILLSEGEKYLVKVGSRAIQILDPRDSFLERSE